MKQEISLEGHRYVIRVDGQEAGFAAFVESADHSTREFNHTVISDEYRGRGLSHPLIATALDETRHNGQKIIATCSAVQHFLHKNPEYQDLVQ